MKMTHYDTLGLKREATPEEIKEAYRRVRGGLHPDREGGDTEAMAAVNAAYTVLSDPVTRAAYDKGLPDGPRDAAEALEAMLSKHLEGEGDPIAAMHIDIEARLMVATTSRANALNAIKTMRRHLTNLRFKGEGENVAARVLKRKIEQRQEDAESLAYLKEILFRVRALLGGYEYVPPFVEPMRWAGAYETQQGFSPFMLHFHGGTHG